MISVRLRNSHVWAVALTMLAPMLGSCSECYEPTGCGPPSIAGSWAGRASGSGAFAAIFAFPDGRVVAYVADGQQLAEWFKRQPHTGNLMTLTSHFGSRLRFTMAQQGFSASWTSAGGSQQLIFPMLPANAPEGLWFGRQTLTDGVEYRGGWIIVSGGDQRGAVVFEGSRGIVATPTLNVSNPLVPLSGRGTLAVLFVTPSYADPTRF